MEKKVNYKIVLLGTYLVYFFLVAFFICLSLNFVLVELFFAITAFYGAFKVYPLIRYKVESFASNFILFGSIGQLLMIFFIKMLIPIFVSIMIGEFVFPYYIAPYIYKLEIFNKDE